MRKLIAALAIFVCFTLCAVTLAQAGPRTVDPGAPAARSDARGQLTIHRLLRDRLEFTLRLARAMSRLELPAPVEEPSGSTHGIIDEPDPAGDKFDRNDEEERESQRRRSEREALNPWSLEAPTDLTFRK